MTPLDRIREWLKDLPDDVQNDIAGNFKEYHDRISGAPLAQRLPRPIKSDSPDQWLNLTIPDDNRIAWLHEWLSVRPEDRYTVVCRALTFRAATHCLLKELTKRGWDEREDKVLLLFHHAEDMAIRNKAERASWLHIAKIARLHHEQIPKLRKVWSEVGKRWRELKKAHLDDGPLDYWRHHYDDEEMAALE